MARLLDALPRGSYLTICEGTNDHYETSVEAQRQYNESGAAPYRLRSARQVAEFFEGLELVEPGWCRARAGARSRRPPRRARRDGPGRRGRPQALAGDPVTADGRALRDGA